jgi:hypothetical protein
MKKSLTIFALLLSLSFQLVAQKTWTGATSTAWNLSGNWNPVGIPTASDNVTIPSGTTHSPTVSGTTGGVCNNLTVNSGATLSITGTSGSSTVLTVGGSATFNGALSIGGYMGNTGKLAAGNVIWNSSSSINAYFGGRMEVSGNFTFASGSSINLGLCWLTFTGGSNSNIYNNSASSSFSNVTLSKTGSAVVYVNSSSTATMTIDGTLNIGAGSAFIGQPNITTILKGNLLNAGNIYLNSGTLSLEKSSGTQDIQINTNDYFNSVVINTGGTVTISTSYYMQLMGSMTIQAGVLNPQNITIALFGDWTNTVGTAGFEEGIGRVIFNGGNYHQFSSNETFFTLEVHKAVGGALRMDGTNVTCNKYDWTAGAIDVLNNGTFTVSNQLLDNGIAGNFYINPGCTINLTNLTGNVDLKGNLYIYGGSFNVYGGVNPSWWPSGGNASITMSGGVLDFVDQSIVVKTDPTYTFTQNITGGTIRTSKDFSNGRSNFTPTGGEIEMYGSTNSLLTMTAGNLHDFSVNKNSGSQVTLNTNATVNSLLLIDEGLFQINNKVLTTNGNIAVNAGGTFWLDLNAQLKIAGNKNITVYSGGLLKVIGTAGNEPVVTRNGSVGNYIIHVNSGGTIAASRASFYYVNPLRVFSGATIDPLHPFHYCKFRYTSAGMLRIDNDQDLLIRNVEFLGPATGYNVYKSVDIGNLEFKDSYGDYSGAAYENDPYNRIEWTVTQPGLWTGAVSTNWYTADNWDDFNIPTAATDVVIPATAPNMPVIDAGEWECNHLDIEGTLTIAGANLTANGNLTVTGTLAMNAPADQLSVFGNVDWESGSQAAITADVVIEAYGNWNFNAGSLAEIDNGKVNFTGNQSKWIRNYSATSCFNHIYVNKTSGSQIGFSDISTEPLLINGDLRVFANGKFVSDSYQDVFLKGDLTSDGITQFNGAALKLAGVSQTLFTTADDYFNHLVFQHSDTVVLHTVGTDTFIINGDVWINSGVVDAFGTEIHLKSHWHNNVGPQSFLNNLGRVIFNGGNYHQHCFTDATFNTIEIDKPLGGALRISEGKQVTCTRYDWTAGALDVLTNASFTANDLADNGIYGNYYVNDGATINLYQDSEQGVDLNGHLTFNIGGTINIYHDIGGLGESSWAAGADASITMDGGTLDFKEMGIYIPPSAYNLTLNITDGVIRTAGSFTCNNLNFNPTGGLLEFYGTTDANLFLIAGSSLYSVKINKGASSKEPGDKLPAIVMGDHETGKTIEDKGTKAQTVNLTSPAIFNGSFFLSSGTFNSNSHTIQARRAWINTAGSGSFVPGTGRVIFNGGNYNQVCYDEEFNILEVDKPIGGALKVWPEKSVTCAVYDYTIGGILVTSGATFTALDLFDNGIYGSYHVETDGTINLYQDASKWIDLNGRFDITDGGTINVYGGSSTSYWPQNDNASITMDGGVLDFKDHGIFVTTSTHTLTTNITGGTIRTAGTFACNRTDFNPTGGTIELYGTQNANLTMSAGSMNNLTINKTADALVTTASTIDILDEFQIVSGIMELLPNAFVSQFRCNVFENGELRVTEGASMKIYSTGEMVIKGGKLQVLGTPANLASIIGGVADCDRLTIQDGGTISASNAYFSGIFFGLYVSSTGWVDPDYAFTNCTFENGYYQLLGIENSQDLIIHDAHFPSASASYNIEKLLDQGSVTFINASGDFSGPDYENDPYNRIHWTECQPGLWTGIASNDWNDPENWDDLALPNSSTSVVIPASAPNMPVLNSETAILVNDMTVLGTLTVGEANLITNFNCTISGSLLMSSGLTEQGYLQVLGDLIFESGSTASLTSTSDVSVDKNLVFNSGSNVQIDNGRLILTGDFISQVINHSENTFIEKLVVDKSDSFYVRFSDASTQHLNVDYLDLWDGSFLTAGDKHFILNKDLDNSGGAISCTEGTFKLDGITQTLKLLPDDYFHHLVFSQTGTASLNTVNTSVLNVNGDLHINSGVFDATGLTIKVGGNWVNIAQPAAFTETGSRVIFNGGDYHQYLWHDEIFDILEVDKPVGGALRVNNGPTIICNVYDWTAGAIDVGNDAEFTANALAGDGIQGDYYINEGCSITLNCSSGNPDLNGNLHIFGGTFTIITPENTESKWPGNGNASISMEGGELNVYPYGIEIMDEPPYTFTSNITGGTIKTSGSFWAWSPGFDPSGGTVELYGSGWVGISGNNGGYFNNLLIDKTTGSNVDISDIKVNENLTVVNGSLKLLSNKTLECPGSISLNSYLSVQRGAAIKLGNNSSFNANTGGMLHFSGSEEEKAKLTGITASDHYDIQFSSGSYLIAAQGIFENMGDQGVNFASGSEILLLTDCEFRYGKSGSTPMLTIDNAQDLLLENITFNGSSKASQFNVRKNVNEGSIFFLDANGDMAGEDYEDDPHGRIHWMPANHASDPQTVGTGVAICEDAFYTLTVADLVVESGGSADLIASQRIKILPGTHIMSGGNMHAWITETHEFCEQQESMLASVSPADEEEDSFLPAMRFASNDDQYHYLNMYPNPTSGIVNIQLNASNPDEEMIIQVYGITGDLREQLYYSGAQTLSLDLSGWNPGVYLIRILDGNKSITGKIIKQ